MLEAGFASVGEFHYVHHRPGRGGAQALDRDAGVIETGKLADLVAIDSQLPALCGLSGDSILDGFAFAAKDDVVTDVWAAGRHMVSEGRHIARDAVFSTYRSAIRQLLNT